MNYFTLYSYIGQKKANFSTLISVSLKKIVLLLIKSINVILLFVPFIMAPRPANTARSRLHVVHRAAHLRHRAALCVIATPKKLGDQILPLSQKRFNIYSLLRFSRICPPTIAATLCLLPNCLYVNGA